MVTSNIGLQEIFALLMFQLTHEGILGKQYLVEAQKLCQATGKYSLLCHVFLEYIQWLVNHKFIEKAFVYFEKFIPQVSLSIFRRPKKTLSNENSRLPQECQRPIIRSSITLCYQLILDFTGLFGLDLPLADPSVNCLIRSFNSQICSLICCILAA